MMARHRGPVLVDTNVIIECWRVGVWRALTGGYRVETVEDCVTETQTGYQRRRPEQQIDAVALRESLAEVHVVMDVQHAAAVVLDSMFAFLDPGEQSLWAHALTRKDTWLLCGPDKASLRFGVRCGFRERLVNLEGLLQDTGHRPATALRANYTARWLAAALNEIVMSERPKRS
jgi:hypothetical protein